VAPFDAILGIPTPPLWVRQLAEAYTAVAKEEVKRAGMKSRSLPFITPTHTSVHADRRRA